MFGCIVVSGLHLHLRDGDEIPDAVQGPARDLIDVGGREFNTSALRCMAFPRGQSCDACI